MRGKRDFDRAGGYQKGLIFDDFSARNTADTPYVCGSGQP
jgi:hypothetical protein